MNLRKTRPWVFYFLAWTLVGLIYFAQNVTRRFYWDDPNPWQDLRYWSVNIHIAALLTPLIVWAGRRWPLERQHLPRLIGAAPDAEHRVGVASAVCSKLHSISCGMNSGRSSCPSCSKSEITLLFIFGFHTGVVTYWVVLSIQTAARNYARFQETAQAALRSDLRASQLETQVAQARLSAFKTQLQPHFLFNTLNATVVLVRQQKGRQAETMMARLSDLLRAVLADMDAQEVTLARELDYLALPIHRTAAFRGPPERGDRRGPRGGRRGRATHGSCSPS